MNASVITTSELKSLMERGEEFILLDVRIGGHGKERLPGSICIPLGELPSRLGELDASKPIVVYCSHIRCRTSPRAAELLRSKGFEVIEFSGGVLGWKEAGFPVVEAPRGD